MTISPNPLKGNKKGNGYAEQASNEELANEIAKRAVKNLPPMWVFHDQLKPLNALIKSQYDVDSAFIMTTMLSFTSAAIGSAVRVGNEFMSDPLILWATLVGISSSGKSLIQKLLIKPLEDIDQYLEELNEEEANKPENKAKEKWSIPRKKFISQHDLFETFTKEIVPDSRKGVIRLIEEQKSWIDGMDAYKGKGGVERPFWLQAWTPAMDYAQGRAGRKTFKIKKEFFTVNVFGGTQPLVVKAFFTDQLKADGFSYRCLFTVPEKVRIAHPDFTVPMPDEVYHPYRKMISDLYHKLEVNTEEDIKYIPVVQSAERMLSKWIKEKADQMQADYEKTDDLQTFSNLSSLIGKIRQYTNRFAAILRVQDAIFDDENVNGLKINDSVMKRAMALGEYYYNAFVAVYDSVSEQIYVPVDVLNRAAIFKACNCNYTTAAEMAGEEKTKFWRQLKKDIKKYPNTYNAKNN